MNYYEHHLGDYAEATAHLTFIEDAAYSRLLRKYYATEQALPCNVSAVARLVAARTDEERAAVEAVLSEFFELRDDGWHNRRCDEEIAKYQLGEPDRQLRRRNEEARLRKHREERQRIFKCLNAAGEHPAYNSPMALLRSMHGQHCNGSCNVSATLQHALPATGHATPATATQTPFPNLQSPVPSLQSPVTSKTQRARSDQPTGTNREPEGERNRKSREFDPESDSAAFALVKAAYPKFAGRQDWIQAEHYCHLRLDDGATWDELIAGAERYAKHIRALGKAGTQYVLTPAKFFNAPDRPWAQDWTLPDDEQQPQKPINGTRRLTPIEIIEKGILDGLTDEQISDMPELELWPTVRRDITTMRQEIAGA